MQSPAKPRSKTAKRNPPREARHAKGLSIRELAAMSGVSYCTIHRCEKRGSWPKYRALRETYQAALGVSESKPAATGASEKGSNP